MQDRVLYIFYYKLWLLELRGQRGTIISGWIILNASIFKKTKTIHKIASRNCTISIPIKSVTSCISPSSTKAFFTRELYIDGSLVKSITLSKNSSGICCCFFLSDGNIWYCFLYFVVTLIAAAFHAEMFFNCSNSLQRLSQW